MAGRPRKEPHRTKARSDAPESPGLRIVGGSLRGRTIAYHGETRTRPMKDRVREAVFNVLGPSVRGTLAIDLFAGTGALGLESLSRGAAAAVFFEQHFPTVRLIERNVADLGVGENCRVVPGNSFVWVRRVLAEPQFRATPWLALCSPPFEFYVSRRDELVSLLTWLREQAPPNSVLMVESDARFDQRLLESFGEWDIREYPPAVVGILRVPG